MLMNGLDGQMTTARSRGIGKRGQKVRLRPAPSPRRANASSCTTGCAALAHEIVLEIDPAVVRANARAHRIVAHRHDARPDAEAAAEIRR